MMTDLVNQIIVECVISAKWKLSTIVKCYKVKRDPLERGTNRGLKLTKQILEIVVRVIEKLIRQQVNIDEMQFGFIPGYGITNATVILRQLQEKYLAKKKNLHVPFVDLEEVFYRVLWDVV